MSRRAGPAFAALLLLLAALTTSGRARAWVEVHVSSDDIRFTVERSGRARVEHRIGLRITGGPLRSFEVRGVDLDAVLEPDAYIVPARDAAASSLASAVPVELELLPPRTSLDPAGSDPSREPPGATLRVRFADRGISRGNYVLFVRYRTQLSASALSRDGGTARLRWRGPLWDDGLDSARVTFVFPAAPIEPLAGDEPRADDVDDVDEAPPSPVFLSTVRRGPDKDELELVRPYAPRGEAIPWTVRFDARVLRPEAAAPVVVSAPLALPPVSLAPARRTLLLAGGGALFFVFAWLTAAKAGQVRRHAALRGVAARPLVPLPTWARAPIAGLLVVAGVALELHLQDGTAGAALVAAAAAFAAHRTPHPARARLRGPGTWLSVREAEALQLPPRPTGASLDVSTRLGKVLLVLGLGGVGAAAFVVSRTSVHHGVLIALDAVALLAIFCTGRIHELPPDPAIAPAQLLRDVARRVRKKLGTSAVRVIPRVRLPRGCADADELRIAFLPRTPLQGLVAIEVGVTYLPGAGGWIGAPEVLLRVVAGSEADLATRTLDRFGRVGPGRRTEERVVVLSPRLPTARMVAAIAASLTVRTSASRAGPAAAPQPAPARRRAA